MKRIIEQLNTPLAFIVVLVVILSINGVLFLRYKAVEGSASTDPSSTMTSPESAQASSVPDSIGKTIGEIAERATARLESTQASSVPASNQQGLETIKQRSPALPKEATTASSEKTGVLRVGIGVVDTSSWLRVRVDGRTVFEDVAEPGFFQEFEANDQVGIEAGNAGAVEVESNGQSQGRLGASGEAGSGTVVRR